MPPSAKSMSEYETKPLANAVVVHGERTLLHMRNATEQQLDRVLFEGKISIGGALYFVNWTAPLKERDAENGMPVWEFNVRLPGEEITRRPLYGHLPTAAG